MEQQPWDIRKNDARTENGLTTFIIFCEDQVSEPIYFRSFSSGSVKINEIGNQRSKKLNIGSAVAKCKDDGLVTFSDGGYRVMEGIEEHIWCVYDRDLESEDLANINPQDNIAFDLSISLAENVGIEVAWSNDCFELWILLHFEVPPDGPFHRNYIYERLTDIFKNLPNQSEDLNALTIKERFSYKESFKHRTEFITFVMPQLKERMAIALANAAILEARYNQTSPPYHERNPCTMVHHLVQAIEAAKLA